MPTGPAESTHEAEPHPVDDRQTAGDQRPRAGLHGGAAFPREGNADDVVYGDQDIDTAGTAHDDLSPTKSL